MLYAQPGLKVSQLAYACKEMGLYGTICGKSIYKGTLDLREAIEYAEKM